MRTQSRCRPSLLKNRRVTDTRCIVAEPLPELDELVRWRQDARSQALRSAVSATKAIRWNPRLLAALVEELHVADLTEELLNVRLPYLDKRRYPEAIAAALILRHSWRADDLRWILQRLGVSRGTRAAPNKRFAGRPRSQSRRPNRANVR